MFPRTPLTSSTRPQDLPGYLLHRIATVIMVCAVQLSPITLIDAAFSAESARRPNIIVILADDKY